MERPHRRARSRHSSESATGGAAFLLERMSYGLGMDAQRLVQRKAQEIDQRLVDEPDFRKNMENHLHDCKANCLLMVSYVLRGRDERAKRGVPEERDWTYSEERAFVLVAAARHLEPDPISPFQFVKSAES